MKTIIHKLISNPSAQVELPEETLEHAKEFITMVNKTKNSEDLVSKMDEHPYFKEMSYLTQVDLTLMGSNLKNTQLETSKLKYTDEIYLQIGQHDLNNIMKNVADMSLSIDIVYGHIGRVLQKK